MNKKSSAGSALLAVMLFLPILAVAFPIAWLAGKIGNTVRQLPEEDADA